MLDYPIAVESGPYDVWHSEPRSKPINSDTPRYGRDGHLYASLAQTRDSLPCPWRPPRRFEGPQQACARDPAEPTRHLNACLRDILFCAQRLEFPHLVGTSQRNREQCTHGRAAQQCAVEIEDHETTRFHRLEGCVR